MIGTIATFIQLPLLVLLIYCHFKCTHSAYMGGVWKGRGDILNILAEKEHKRLDAKIFVNELPHDIRRVLEQPIEPLPGPSFADVPKMFAHLKAKLTRRRPT